MEEFKAIDVVFDLMHRRVESQGVVDDLSERLLVYIVAKEAASYLQGYLLERELVDALEKRVGQAFDVFGHIQSAVGSQSVLHSLTECGHRSFMIG